MKRTRTIALAATAMTALSFTGAGALAYAQTAPTTGPGTPGGTNGHKPHGPRAQLFDAAAKALGISSADLKAALDGGKTVAQVAQDKGVDVNAVITAVTDAANKAIDQAVTDGKMTADQAAQEKSEVAQHVTDFVNGVKHERGPGGGGEHRGPKADVLAAAAGALNMSTDELKAALDGGKTVAQVAQDKGVDVNTVIAAVTDAANTAIDQAVTDGKMTADQAAQEKTEVTQRVTDFVNKTKPPKGEHGPGGRGPGGPGGPGARFGNPIATAATALNMSAADLHAALEGGKTIAQVAQDKGVDPNAVITALTDAANKAIDQAVTDGRLSADQATQAKAKAAEHAATIVNNPPPKRR